MRRILLATIVLAAVALMSGCARQIEAGLSEKEAHEIVVTLREGGIDAFAEAESDAAPAGGANNKEGTPWRVKVRGGSEKEILAWKVLREHGLPREKVKGLEEVYKNQGMIPSPTEEKAKLLLGLSGEATKLLENVDGVVDAKVNVVQPDNNNLLDRRDQNAPTAAVLVRYRSEHSPLTDDEIRGLVAKSVEGLSPSNVAVVQKRAVEKPLPPEEKLGPLNSGEWLAVSALTLSGLSSAGAVSMLVLSKRRALRIKMLERQLAQVSGGPSESGRRIEAKG